MNIQISGTFKVNLTPQALSYEHQTSLQLGRLNLDKTFEGPLSGKSRGEMLSALDPQQKSGGYVAIEVFEDTLEGRSGSFAMQHYGKTDPDGQTLILEIVPGSGEGELQGIAGKMQIRIENGQHFYDLEAELNVG